MSPFKQPPGLTSARARFWPKVDTSGECWIWRGARAVGGYGNFYLLGQSVRAHRAALLLTGTPLPEGIVVRHRCDNPSCVRPAHLEPGTQADNLRDMRARGRARNVPAERNVAKTHCHRGHEFTPQNTLRSNGRRICRECKRAADRAAIRARRAERGAS